MKLRPIHLGEKPFHPAAGWLIQKILCSDAAAILLAIVLVLVLIGLGGCAPIPAAPATTASPTPTPLPTQTPAPALPTDAGLPPGPPARQPTPTPGESALPENSPIVLTAKTALNAKLNVPSDSITFVSAEYVEWSTSCLGLEQPREICLDVITPGYRVILMVQGGRYEVHTNASGSVVRLK